MLNIVKNTTFISPLDLLIPHSCRGCGYIGTVLCERCKKYILANHHNLCPHCKTDNPTGDCQNCPDLPPTYTLGERTGLLDDIVHNYKYQSIRALSSPLAELLDAILPTSGTKYTTIVPLPTIPRHIRTRGFDHTKLLAKHLAALHGTNYRVEPLLLRTNNTTQVGTDRATRLSQAASAYQLNPKYHIEQNTTYLLLDDVWTTGASLRTCQKLLQQAGATHLAIAILAVSRIN